ncbi:MAG: ATP-binding protein [Clostridiales bacterium]|nr:ATP-binding protein [Clostridiales bacterium]
MNSYDKAVREIVNRRREDLDAATILWNDALRADERLRAAFSDYQAEMIKNAMGEPDTLKKSQEKLVSEIARLGIDKSVFSPPPHCKACNDTGYVKGKYCKCVIREAIKKDKNNLTLPIIDFAKYSKTAPSAIKKLYAEAKKFIDSYPNGEKVFFNIIGNPGTGKSILAAAIASSFISKGASAVTVTAFDFVRRALDYHTQFKIDDYIDRFTPMLDCELLVIDDLGKESMFKNVTLEYLYAVIDARWRAKKYTVITSNLTPDGIISRYGEAITSRLLDKSVALNFTVFAKNSRIS